MNKIKVFLADDHLIIRDGLKKLFEFEDDIEVVGEAGNGIDCINGVLELKPDVLLLDLSMPKVHGIEVLNQLKKKRLATKTLVVTVHDEFSYFRKAMAVGAAGYILKDSDFDSFLTAIHSVYENNRYVDKKLLPQYNDFMNSGEDFDLSFTKRETEILILIARGLSNKEIAEQLFISDKTVKNHITGIFDKIHVKDRTQAALYAIKNNYVNI
ncbi:MAG: response regulator transcription factor [Lachnospiraceae bacterium]|nr:response regulator transcription factor [Lachnospiraceae bacterium]